MREHFIKFIDKDVDGSRTNITIIARVCGKNITVGIINKIKDAICSYKNENEGDWNTDGCIDAAQEQLEKEGYKVYWVNTYDAEICL